MPPPLPSLLSPCPDHRKPERGVTVLLSKADQGNAVHSSVHSSWAWELGRERRQAFTLLPLWLIHLEVADTDGVFPVPMGQVDSRPIRQAVHTGPPGPS